MREGKCRRRKGREKTRHRFPSPNWGNWKTQQKIISGGKLKRKKRGIFLRFFPVLFFRGAFFFRVWFSAPTSPTTDEARRLSAHPRLANPVAHRGGGGFPLLRGSGSPSRCSTDDAGPPAGPSGAHPAGCRWVHCCWRVRKYPVPLSVVVFRGREVPAWDKRG